MTAIPTNHFIGLRAQAGFIAVIAAAVFLGSAQAQESAPPAAQPPMGKIAPLTFRTTIALPGVYGRMDHYGWDSKRGHLIVSALGNNSVEIVSQWKRIHTINGFEYPQTSVYLPEVDRIAVSSQSGKLRFFDAQNFALLKTLDFGEGANTDNMRYDAASKLLYVGYGERARGAIASVDVTAMERREEFRVDSHPESFQLEAKGPRIFVNIPDQGSMAVVDRKSGAVTKWKVAGGANAHALAFDEANRRLFTISLQPGRLTVLDSDSGKLIAGLDTMLGVDDLWYDAERKRIYATGAGATDIIQQTGADHYALLTRIATPMGSGSTSLRVKTRTQDSLFLSRPNALAQGGSEILLYYVND